MKILLVNLFCFICLGAVAADMFGEDDANPSLFGIQLGQTISVDDAELFSRYTLCTNGTYRHSQDIYIPDQWECYGFTPEQKFQDPQFSRHRIFIDGASRQVVAVDAHFDSVILPWQWDNPPSAQFTNLLERVFREYGQCETRLSYELWSSGIIYRTTFFTTSGAGIVISHHQQFGGNLCLYRVSSIIGKSRVGMVLPDSYQAPSPQEQIFFGKYMRLHPALELYEQYRSRRRTAIGISE
ncbi:MAG: hypothetical protein ILM98_09795 [Kiritimatiellae bacterium]|nr:hypothetical protein [Kiritimatiellia bacterium]